MIWKIQNYLNQFKKYKFSSEQIAKKIVQNRAWLILILPASQVKVDSSSVSFTIDNSEDYKDYLAFIESFGTDDYIILAAKNTLNISDPKLKKVITPSP